MCCTLVECRDKLMEELEYVPDNQITSSSVFEDRVQFAAAKARMTSKTAWKPGTIDP